MQHVSLSERANVRNLIIEGQHEMLKAAVTNKKTFQNGKIVEGKHILMTPDLELHNSLVEWEKSAKKRKSRGQKS